MYPSSTWARDGPFMPMPKIYDLREEVGWKKEFLGGKSIDSFYADNDVRVKRFLVILWIKCFLIGTSRKLRRIFLPDNFHSHSTMMIRSLHFWNSFKEAGLRRLPSTFVYLGFFTKCHYIMKTIFK